MAHCSAETAPVTVKTRKPVKSVVERRRATAQGRAGQDPQPAPGLRQAEGTITAANSSSISDGGSALLLMSEQPSGSAAACKPHGAHCRPRPPQPGTRQNSPSPPSAPMQQAVREDRLEQRPRWTCSRSMKPSPWSPCWQPGNWISTTAKVNVHGGACAQGHPIGSTGSRIIVSLMYALQKLGKKRGVAALCIGGGEATAVAIELI